MVLHYFFFFHFCIAVAFIWTRIITYYTEKQLQATRKYSKYRLVYRKANQRKDSKYTPHTLGFLSRVSRHPAQVGREIGGMSRGGRMMLLAVRSTTPDLKTPGLICRLHVVWNSSVLFHFLFFFSINRLHSALKCHPPTCFFFLVFLLQVFSSKFMIDMIFLSSFSVPQCNSHKHTQT
jgi:hypothetical protein